MTSHFTRFAFDREYAPDGTVLRDGEKVRRVFTEDEARSLADAAAREAAASEESRSAAAAAEALRQIAGRMQAVLARMDAESEALREDAVRLALTAAGVIAGAALERFGADTVEACVRDAMAELRAEPRLAVRVAPALADSMAERLYEQAQLMGFEGAVIVRADAEAAPGDVVLEWRAGAIERTASDIAARLQAAAEKWLAAPAGEGAADAAGSESETGGEAA
ncbi:hypothetical protein F1654_10060 [Alkalicaulis satelles]|uniref:Uncharacterized protein n=1 Tax=Alkalicaulis satelles TaxID=2609175 RepID=A0A5M6ZED8_9PROT|nr:FliH/SctL family protein [Alkalicaulis satelles]KAA5802177.1 hypothetical protein F1654_10060 [Alkalicaulis satelles]